MVTLIPIWMVNTWTQFHFLLNWLNWHINQFFCPLCISTDSKSWISFVTTIGTKRMASEGGVRHRCVTLFWHNNVSVSWRFFDMQHTIPSKENAILDGNLKCSCHAFPLTIQVLFIQKNFLGLSLTKHRTAWTLEKCWNIRYCLINAPRALWPR